MNRTFNGPVPDRIEALPKDHRGFPIPFFVAYVDGKPLFPVMDPEKMRLAMRFGKCWICGTQLGGYKCFAIGPMCAINRINSEPPSHADCARFAALNCPFMTQPLAKRVDSTGYDKPGGVMIERNPGVTCLWTTRSFEIIWDGPKGERKPLWRLLGLPTSLQFYAKGRLASRSEVNHSVNTGLPILREAADADGPQAYAELVRQVDAFAGLLDGIDWPPEVETDPRNFGNPDFPEIDLGELFREEAP